MSLAWSTVAFLILLLPGFLFFVGLYLPENFTRETAPKTALGQLAGTVFIAFLIHGLLFAITWSGESEWIPRVRLDHLLQLLDVEPLDDRELTAIVENVEAHRLWILVYVMATSALGLWAGYEFGCLMVGGPLRRLAEHAWVYDLKVEGGSERSPGITLKILTLYTAVGSWHTPKSLTSVAEWVSTQLAGPQLRTVTVTYVLTDISHEGRYMMYRGFLKAFGISKDGKPLYLVLSNAMRAYMLLEDFGPRTSSDKGWHLIGGAAETSPDLPGPRLSSYLTVSDEHISNVMFDRHGFTQTAAGLEVLEREYAKVVELTAHFQGVGALQATPEVVGKPDPKGKDE